MVNRFDVQIRSMNEQDLPDVVRIQSTAHTVSLHESFDVFKSKLHIFREGCFVAQCNSITCGYLFSHPWTSNVEVPFDSIYSLPQQCDTFHIHDCTVNPGFQNSGIGLQLFTKSKKVALTHNFRSLQLISIRGMQNYWVNKGFTLIDSVLPKHFGSNACLMRADIA